MTPPIVIAIAIAIPIATAIGPHKNLEKSDTPGGEGIEVNG
jgi:hypothetical protein